MNEAPAIRKSTAPLESVRPPARRVARAANAPTIAPAVVRGFLVRSRAFLGLDVASSGPDDRGQPRAA